LVQIRPVNRNQVQQTAPASEPGNTDKGHAPTRGEFLAAHPPPDSAFIDEKQLLARLPVSRRTLFNWRFSGKLPFVNLGGRRNLYHWPSIESALLRMQRGGGQ
jgi:hypothetical protein